ncbi:transposase-like protein [Oxalobacteraceae bacterium GrIS 2.11]
MDETYIQVGGQWKYLYRAVDRLGHTVDFLLTVASFTYIVFWPAFILI